MWRREEEDKDIEDHEDDDHDDRFWIVLFAC